MESEKSPKNENRARALSLYSKKMGEQLPEGVGKFENKTDVDTKKQKTSGNTNTRIL